MPQPDCQGELSGNQSRHVLFSISFIFGPKTLSHKGIQEGKIVNGLIFPSKVKGHLSKAKKAVKLLEVLCISSQYFK